MQIHRLFEIVYLLLDKRRATAAELAARFEVSTRTIYRDIDILSSAGFPIYTSKGKGGGIGLVDEYVLNRSLLTEREQNDILFSLESLRAMRIHDVEPVLDKLRALFRNRTPLDWIEVDFAPWGGGGRDRDTFRALKTAILGGFAVSFSYVGSNGERTSRMVDPAKLLWKGRAWYLHGFCRLRGEYRLFRCSRIRDLKVLDGSEEPAPVRSSPPPPPPPVPEEDPAPRITLVLRLAPSQAHRVYDEFDPGRVRPLEDGGFVAEADCPDGEWLYGYVLSFGDGAEVLSPPHVRDAVRAKLEAALRRYRR